MTRLEAIKRFLIGEPMTRLEAIKRFLIGEPMFFSEGGLEIVGERIYINEDWVVSHHELSGSVMLFAPNQTRFVKKYRALYLEVYSEIYYFTMGKRLDIHISPVGVLFVDSREYGSCMMCLNLYTPLALASMRARLHKDLYREKRE